MRKVRPTHAFSAEPSPPSVRMTRLGRKRRLSIRLWGTVFRKASMVDVVRIWISPMSKNVPGGEILSKTKSRSDTPSTVGTKPSNPLSDPSGRTRHTRLRSAAESVCSASPDVDSITSPLGNVMYTGGTSSGETGGHVYRARYANISGHFWGCFALTSLLVSTSTRE